MRARPAGPARPARRTRPGRRSPRRRRRAPPAPAGSPRRSGASGRGPRPGTRASRARGRPPGRRRRSRAAPIHSAIFAAFPSMSPTVGLIWASARLSPDAPGFIAWTLSSRATARPRAGYTSAMPVRRPILILLALAASILSPGPPRLGIPAGDSPRLTREAGARLIRQATAMLSPARRPGARASAVAHAASRPDPVLIRLARAMPALPPAQRRAVRGLLARPTDNPDPDGESYPAAALPTWPRTAPPTSASTGSTMRASTTPPTSPTWPRPTASPTTSTRSRWRRSRSTRPRTATSAGGTRSPTDRLGGELEDRHLPRRRR